jgi:invasion protein IalB
MFGCRQTKYSVIVFLAVGSVVNSANVLSDPIPIKDKFDYWTLYCNSASRKPKMDECSIISAVAGETDPHKWAKFAFSFLAHEMQITVRTPRLQYLRQGVVLGIDGDQIGRIFVDECTSEWCEFSASLSYESIVRLSEGRYISAEYRHSETEGIRLVNQLSGFTKAARRLYEATDSTVATLGTFSRIRAYLAWLVRGSTDDVIRFSLDIRPIDAPAFDDWGARGPHMKMCDRERAPLLVQLNAFQIDKGSFVALDRWVNENRECASKPNMAVWITDPIEKAARAKGQPDPGLNAFSKVVVQEFLAKKGLPRERMVVTDVENQRPISVHSGWSLDMP